MLAGWGVGAFALDPTMALTQYAHKTWKIGDAGLTSAPAAIAQTHDGYIWIGTGTGLYRFDGVAFSPWRPPGGGDPFARGVSSLYVARSGDLYVGGHDGLGRISGGRLHPIPGPFEYPGPFVEDRKGDIWFTHIGHHTNASAFCLIKQDTPTCYGRKDGILCNDNGAILLGDGDQLIVGGGQGACRWSARNGALNEPFPQSVAKRGAMVNALARTPDGRLWAAPFIHGPGAGLLIYQDGTWKTYVSPELDGRTLEVYRLSVDSHGALWIGTVNSGIYRLSRHHLEHFASGDGLTGDLIYQTMEDREGSFWVATNEGLDQFQDLAVRKFSRREGLGTDTVWAVAATPDDSVWVAENDRLDRITAGRAPVPAYPNLSWRLGTAREFSDSAGRLWIGDQKTLRVLSGGTIQTVHDPQGRDLPPPETMTEDVHGDVWVSSTDYTKVPLLGLLWRVHGTKAVQRILSPEAGGRRAITKLASDGGGGLWVGIYRRGLFHFANGQFWRVEAIDSHAIVTGLQPVPDGDLWLSTVEGVVWLHHGQAHSLGVAQGLPCATARSVILDRSAALWIETLCGLVELPPAEYRRWQADPSYRPRFTVFDASAGYVSDQNATTPAPALATDGRLWFVANDDLRSIDPGHIIRNDLAPPLQIQHVLADHKPYPLGDTVTLPKLSRDIEIDYAGLSYIRTEHLQFKYRLIGHDRDWTAVGTRRQAFYNDLPPGAYRFELSACNADGACSPRPLRLPIIIPPAFYQTRLFELAALAAAIGAIVLFVRWRLRASTETLRIRYDERLQERTRVARDLHDTLMQTVMASKLVADDASRATGDPERSTEAIQRISEWLGRAAREGRDAIEALRASPLETNDLAEAIELTLLEEQARVGFAGRLSLTGEPRDMHPIVRDEVYRIACEAIRNAGAHADASDLYVDLVYRGDLTLTVRDNGQGIEETTLKEGRPGHFGLMGMQERAARIGATLTIESNAQGTTITVVAPGRTVFQAHRPSRRLIAWLSGGGKPREFGEEPLPSPTRYQ